MVVAVNGHKGMTVSLMTKGMRIWWPERLDEIVSAKDFVMISKQWVEYRQKGTENVTKVPTLQDFFRTAGKHFPNEYFILDMTQWSLHTFYLHDTDTVSEIIQETQNTKKGTQIDGMYKIGNYFSNKFAMFSKYSVGSQNQL